MRFDAIRVISTGEYRITSPQILRAVNADIGWFSTLGKTNGLSLEKLRSMGLSTLGKKGVWIEYKTSQGVKRSSPRESSCNKMSRLAVFQNEYLIVRSEALHVQPNGVGFLNEVQVCNQRLQSTADRLV